MKIIAIGKDSKLKKLLGDIDGADVEVHPEFKEEFFAANFSDVDLVLCLIDLKEKKSFQSIKSWANPNPELIKVVALSKDVSQDAIKAFKTECPKIDSFLRFPFVLDDLNDVLDELFEEGELEEDHTEPSFQQINVDGKVRDTIEKHSVGNGVAKFDNEMNRQVQEVFDEVFPSKDINELIKNTTGMGFDQVNLDSLDLGIETSNKKTESEGKDLEISLDQDEELTIDASDDLSLDDDFDESTGMTQVMSKNELPKSEEQTSDAIDEIVGDSDDLDLELGDDAELVEEGDIDGEDGSLVLKDMSGSIADLKMDGDEDSFEEVSGELDLGSDDLDLSDENPVDDSTMEINVEESSDLGEEELDLSSDDGLDLGDDESFDLGDDEDFDLSESDEVKPDETVKTVVQPDVLDEVNEPSLDDLGLDEESELLDEENLFEDSLEDEPIEDKVEAALLDDNIDDLSEFDSPATDIPIANDASSLNMQATIKQLRQSREKLLKEVEDLKEKVRVKGRDHLSLRSELDEAKIEVSILQRKNRDQRESYRTKIEALDQKRLFWETKYKKEQEQNFKYKDDVRVDVHKIKNREKELESKLELLSIDAQNQVRSRDDKILELKRKIDALEFNMENSAIKEQKSKDDKVKLEEKLSRIMKTLRGSIEVLEDDIDSEF